MTALSLAASPAAHPGLLTADFGSYLEHSLHNPVTLDLSESSLLEVIDACSTVKSKFHPHFRENVRGLVFNLKQVEAQYGVELKPVQVTDIFYGYFIAFCESRGLKTSSIKTMCCYLRSVLSWGAKYNATVSPTFTDFSIRRTYNHEIALTADEVSGISYFDIDRFYAGRRKDFRETMHRVRDMFVLSCNLFQRHSDSVRIEPSCFDRNIFTITQQKTGAVAVVNIDRYSIDARTTYRILDQYNYHAPYKAGIGNYNWYLHEQMKDIGFTEPVRREECIRGNMVVSSVPKWKEITSHTARRTATTIAVMRGHNVNEIRRCTGHSDLSGLGRYIRDD